VFFDKPLNLPSMEIPAVSSAQRAIEASV